MSVGFEGEGDWFSSFVSISDGAVVAFSSASSNLVPGEPNDPPEGNGPEDLFVRYLPNGPTVLVSVSSEGVEGNGISGVCSISADNRYVAFESVARNLVPDDTNDTTDVFVHDLDTGQTFRASVSSQGGEGNSFSLGPSLSADGSCVVFLSNASNLVAGDTNDTFDEFVHVFATGETWRVSVGTGGIQANALSHNYPSPSADCSLVAFNSTASNLVPNDINGMRDAFVHELATGVTTLVSLSKGGVQGNGDSWFPSLSADGRYVAFDSIATNLDDEPSDGSRLSAVRDQGFESDVDEDGICDTDDNCPTTSNEDQLDGDKDGIGDVCDACPNDQNNDIDGDDVCGDVDNCPATFNPDQSDGNGTGIGDACDTCASNAYCGDGDPCTFVRCIDALCDYAPAAYGDVGGSGGTCGPDKGVGLADILAVLDGFGNIFAEGCEASNIDIAGAGGTCGPDGVINLTDILAVLDAFQGAAACCPDE